MSVYRGSPLMLSDEELARNARGKFRIERTPGGILFRWWWLNRSVLWWGMGAAFSFIFSRGMGNRWRSAADLWSFPVILFGFSGVLLTYLAVMNLINRTCVLVEDGSIRVTYGPLWAGRGARMRLDDIAQLYVYEKVYGTTKKSIIEYHLRAKTVSGGDVTLVEGPMTPSHVRALEATLEALLRIEDAPVPDELAAAYGGPLRE